MAKNDELTGDALTQEVVKYLHKGKNLKQVAELLGISVEEADGVWSAYVNDRKQMPFDQQFILHLERLENLLNIAHENLEGDFDADDVEVTLKILDRIEDLQATALSRKQAAEDSLQVLANVQVDLFYKMLNAVEGMYRMAVEGAFETNDFEKAKESLVTNFGSTFGEITQKAYEEEVVPYEV